MVIHDLHDDQLLHASKGEYRFRPILTKEQRERDELREDLDGILPFVEFDPDQIKELAEILYAQGYRKPDAGPRKGGE